MDSHLIFQQFRQVVEARSNLRVVNAQHLLTNCQRAPVQPLDLSAVALCSHQVG